MSSFQSCPTLIRGHDPIGKIHSVSGIGAHPYKMAEDCKYASGSIISVLVDPVWHTILPPILSSIRNYGYVQSDIPVGLGRCAL